MLTWALSLPWLPLEVIDNGGPVAVGVRNGISVLHSLNAYAVNKGRHSDVVKAYD